MGNNWAPDYSRDISIWYPLGYFRSPTQIITYAGHIHIRLCILLPSITLPYRPEALCSESRDKRGDWWSGPRVNERKRSAGKMKTTMDGNEIKVNPHQTESRAYPTPAKKDATSKENLNEKTANKEKSISNSSTPQPPKKTKPEINSPLWRRHNRTPLSIGRTSPHVITAITILI